MIGLAIYIGLFVWGMQSERLTWRHPAVIAALVIFQLLLTFAILRDGLGNGTLAISDLAVGVMLEIVIQAVVLLLGFYIGRYRRRGQSAQSDLEDTFN